MVSRQFATTDYPTVSNWWAAHKFPVIPLDLLPRTGLVVEGACAGFLYATDSGICWLEWVVANPALEAGPRGEALDCLIDGLCDTAAAMGFKFVFSSATNKRLIERMQKHGFGITDTGMTHMIRGVTK